MNVKVNLQRFRQLFLAFVFLCFFLMLTTGCTAKKNSTQSNLEVKAQIGYDGVVALSEGNPVQLEVKNKGGTIKGQIEVDIPINAIEKTIVSLPFELPASAEKRIAFYVPIRTVEHNLTYRIKNNQALVYEGQLKISKTLSPVRPIIAVVADAADNYRFFNAIQINKNRITGEAAYYSKNNLQTTSTDQVDPYVVYLTSLKGLEDKRAYDFFDLVFIGDSSDVGVTNKNSLQISHWIKNGGIFVIESGDHYKKLLKQIPEELTQVAFNKIEDVKFDLSILDFPFVGNLQLLNGDIKKPKTNPMRIQNYVLGYREYIGKGQLVTLNTSLTKGDVANWNTDGRFLQFIIDYFRIESMASDTVYHDTYFISDLLNYIPMKQALPIKTIMIILVVYMILVGPALYFVLKKIDRRKLLWLIAPSLSVVVIFTIYFIGSSTWGSKPISNEISFIEYEQGEDVLNINTHVAIYNNKNKTMKLTYSGEENIELDVSEDFHYMKERKEKTLVSKWTLSDPLTYNNYKVNLWQPVFGRLNKVVPLEKGEENEVALIEKDGKKSIVFKNPTPLDLDHAIVLYGGSHYLIGRVEAGSKVTCKLDKSNRVYLDGAFHHSPSKQPQKNEIKKNFYTLVQMAQINNYNIDRIVIIGFNEESVGYKIEVNDSSVATFSRNVVVLNLPLYFKIGTEVTLEKEALRFHMTLLRNDKEDPLEFHRFTETGEEICNVYGAKTLLTTIEIPQKIKPNEVVINFDNNYKRSHKGSRHVADYKADQYYIYNFKTQIYDEKLPADSKGRRSTSFYQVNLERYLGPNNEIKIKTVKDDNYIINRIDYDIKKNDIEIRGSYQ